MPRGVKGSGKAKEATATKRPYNRKKKADDVSVTEVPVADTPVAENPVVEIPVEMVVGAGTVNITEKPRKSYPSANERIAMADQQIERLTNLKSSREMLIAKTEAILTERQKALVSCTTALEKAIAKKERLIAAQSRLPKALKEKLTPEERKARMAAGSTARKAQNEKYAALV